MKMQFRAIPLRRFVLVEGKTPLACALIFAAECGFDERTTVQIKRVGRGDNRKPLRAPRKRDVPR